MAQEEKTIMENSTKPTEWLLLKQAIKARITCDKVRQEARQRDSMSPDRDKIPKVTSADVALTKEALVLPPQSDLTQEWLNEHGLDFLVKSTKAMTVTREVLPLNDPELAKLLANAEDQLDSAIDAIVKLRSYLESARNE